MLSVWCKLHCFAASTVLQAWKWAWLSQSYHSTKMATLISQINRHGKQKRGVYDMMLIKWAWFSSIYSPLIPFKFCTLPVLIHLQTLTYPHIPTVQSQCHHHDYLSFVGELLLGLKYTPEEAEKGNSPNNDETMGTSL